jgi:ligand-binding sensor domain-containing protein/signal transduction histidine kinase
MIPCALLALFIIGRAGLAADNLAWFTRAWQTDDGLPNNIVTSLAQTPDGFLWAGTPAGLARFDGVRFTKISSLNSADGDDPAVHTLSLRSAGGLWIAPSRGALVGLDRNLSPVPPLARDMPDAQPLMVAEDSENSLWIGYNNGNLCRVKPGQVTRFTALDGIASGTINSLVCDQGGNLWLAKGTRVEIYHDGRFQQLAVFRNGSHLAAARTNGVWIVAGKQLFKCDAAGNLQDCGACLPENSDASSRVVLEDRHGGIWTGTDGAGVYRRDAAGIEKIGTSFNYISSLLEDGEGNVWAGTLGGGLDRISPCGVKFEKTSSAVFDAVQSVCEDAHGKFWGATQSGLLVSRDDGGDWIPALTNLNLPHLITCVAAGRDGTVWFGTRNSKSIYRWRNNALETLGQAEGFSENSAIAALCDSRTNLWLGINASHITPCLVQCFNGGKFRTLDLPTNSARVVTFAEDAAGKIWAGTFSGALLRADGDHFSDQTSLTTVSGRTIRCLLATPDGALWIGYAGWGLGRLKDGNFTRISTEQGLPEDYISQIVADPEGWFWFGGDHGIFKIRQDELAAAMQDHSKKIAPVSFGKNEGLSNVQIDYGFWPGAIRSQDGKIWMPTRTTLVVINPEVLHETAHPPPVLLTRVAVDDIAATNLPAALELSPYHHNLKFEFTAFNFSAPENLRFRYRLDGLDNNWSDADRRSAEYSRLAHGNYVFRVQAAEGDGAWNDLTAPLNITVLPFFWQQWWFQALVVVAFTLLVIAVVRYVSFRRLRHKLQLLAQQAALDNERARIARDLHDDLGGNLTQVKQFFELALRHHDSPEKMGGYLQRGLAKTQQGIKSLDETVWAVNPRNDTLPNFIDYLGQAAVEFLHAAGIRCRADLPANPPGKNISAEARHNLLFAVKEALNNVVRHAHAAEVRIEAQVTEKSLVLAVKDDGCGFEKTNGAATADGLRNMQQRMAEIGGTFAIESRAGAGTRVELVYFWPPERN